MENKEKILGHLLRVGKANTYRIASALKISTTEVTEVLDELSKEGKVEFNSGVARLAKQGTAEKVRENIEGRMKTLEEKQKLALTKLKEAVGLLE